MEIMAFSLFLIVALLLYLYAKNRKDKQIAFIQSYEFHPVLGDKIREAYPHLEEEQILLVFQGLRDYFIFCNQSKRRMVAMPSQVVDLAWHEFILFTRAYLSFSKKAIGKFLHHTPTTAMKSPTMAQDGIKRAWRLACTNEGINPSSPNKLPLLFALDSMLCIEDGFKYSLNCKDKSSPYYGDGYCAGHIACASGCGGDSGYSSDSDGFFDNFDGGSDCGGGCGGD
jgi:hypothetical protein